MPLSQRRFSLIPLFSLGENIDLELAELAAGDSSGGGGGCVAIKSKVEGPWFTEEDAVLTKLVTQLGPRNWSLIARGISGRSGKSCRLRWCNQPHTKSFLRELLYKPIVLSCGHLSCFWCVHKSMNGLRESNCPICREKSRGRRYRKLQLCH